MPYRSRIRRTWFTEEQMVTILREAGAAPVAEVAKKYSDRVGDSR
ncbi:MAG TPA: hypothetical protein VGT07_03080 [Steroidobacteraceae bacterium]|nr:hypothetical protein [Steroidobacteraceae bacterium]